MIYRWDAPLFFANVRPFRDNIRHLARTEPKPRWIVIAAEPITDVDTTAADVLLDLDVELNAQGISLVFAEVKHRTREKIEKYGLTREIEPEHFYPTTEAAVAAVHGPDRRQMERRGVPAGGRTWLLLSGGFDLIRKGAALSRWRRQAQRARHPGPGQLWSGLPGPRRRSRSVPPGQPRRRRNRRNPP